MKKEEIKGKVKNFAEEHKKGLKTVAITGLAVSGVCFGWKLCDVIKIGNGVVIGHKPTCDVINDAVKRHSNNMLIFSGLIEKGEALKPEELGELGDIVKEACEANGLENFKGFTHFVMLGEKSK